MAVAMGYSDLWGDYGRRKRSRGQQTSRRNGGWTSWVLSELNDEPESEALDALGLLAQVATLAEAAESESEDASQPHHKRFKRRHGSASEEEPTDTEKYQHSDSEALHAMHASRRMPEDPAALHYAAAGLPGGASSSFRGNFNASSLAAAQPGMNSHGESHPLPPKETFLPGQTLGEKRCASHVYIARFIEYQTNKLRLQQPRQRPGPNGYGNLHSAPGEALDRGGGGANGNFHKASLPMLPEPSVAHLPPHPQVPLSGGMPHPYMGSQQFPTASLPLSLQGLPPQYAQVLAQQQHNGMGGMASGFPFLQGLQFNGSLAQQQAAVANALASQQSMMDFEKLKALGSLGGSLNGMPPHLMAALSSFGQNAMNGKPAPQLPPASLGPPPRKMEQQNGSRPQNGASLKMEDDSSNMQRMGVVPPLMPPNGQGQGEALSAMDHYLLLEAFKKGQIPHLPLEPWGGAQGNNQKL